jgi:hypothetical protein
MVPLTFALAGMHGLVGVAFAQAISMGLGFIASSVVLARTLELSWRTFAAQLLRPALASLAMVAIVHATWSWLMQQGIASAVAHLAVGVAVGVVAFVVGLGAVWLLSGRPAGAELTLARWVGRMSAQWARRRIGSE